MYEKYVLKKKNELRIKYAESVSFKTDVYIFMRTVWRVLRKAMGVSYVVKDLATEEGNNGVHYAEKF